MRKFVIATGTAALLLTGIATATADPVASAAAVAAAQPATDITGSFDPSTIQIGGSTVGSMSALLANPAPVSANLPTLPLAGSVIGIMAACSLTGQTPLCNML